MTSPDLHTIDEYLLNRLEGADLAAFEQQLAQDESLASELRQRRELLTVVDSIGDLSMKNRVGKIHRAELEKASAPQRRIQPWKWAVAASFLLVAGICLWLWARPPAPEQLYARYYEPYALSFGSRSSEAEQQLAAAGSLYKAGNYAEALPVFESVLSTAPGDSKARLAAGICQLELQQYDRALAHFQYLIDANDPLYLEQALWYSAMTQLRRGDVPACRNLLEKIVANKNGFFYGKAVAVLEGL